MLEKLGLRDKGLGLRLGLPISRAHRRHPEAGFLGIPRLLGAVRRGAPSRIHHPVVIEGLPNLLWAWAAMAPTARATHHMPMLQVGGPQPLLYRPVPGFKQTHDLGVRNGIDRLAHCFEVHGAGYCQGATGRGGVGCVEVGGLGGGGVPCLVLISACNCLLKWCQSLKRSDAGGKGWKVGGGWSNDDEL